MSIRFEEPADQSPLLMAKIQRLAELRELLVKAEEASQAAGLQSSDADPGRFYDDPVGFAEQCIDFGTQGGLTPYQKDILAQIPVRKKVAVRGPHGLGKSTTSAVAVLWFALTRDARHIDWKIATTAGAWRQLERYLWPEIRKWAKRIRWDVLGRMQLDERTELLSLNLKLDHGTAFAVASSNPELIEGVHADSVLYVFDESKAIAAGTFEAAEGAFSGASPDGGLPEAFALACSTPGEPNGTFYDIHAKRPGLEDWWTRHVTLSEAIAAGRVAEGWAEQRRKQWGENSAVYHNRVLGEFYSSDEDGVIPLAWIDAAFERWRAWYDSGAVVPESGLRVVGVDVARSGTDKTVMALRFDNVVHNLRHTSKEDTMQTANRVKGILDRYDGMMGVVDVIGIGAGVVDRLREQHLPVDGFNSSAGTRRKDKSGELGFINCRAAAWWNLREMLEPNSGFDLALPPDDVLLGDLTAPHWKVTTGGRIQVEDKDSIRKRIGRSPDDGDAVVMAMWPQSIGWADAYGLIYCTACDRPFLGELHPLACPHCKEPRH